MLSRVFIQTSTIQIYIFGFLKHQIKTAVHKNGLRFYLVSFYSHSMFQYYLPLYIVHFILLHPQYLVILHSFHKLITKTVPK